MFTLYAVLWCGCGLMASHLYHKTGGLGPIDIIIYPVHIISGPVSLFFGLMHFKWDGSPRE